LIRAVPSRTGGTFTWSPGNYTTDTILVSPDTTTDYTVTYTIVGCTRATAVSTVKVTPGVFIALNTGETSCGLSNGAIEVNASQGAPPYRYALNSEPYQLADSFTNLGSGSYTVHVSDTNGCSSTAQDTIKPSTPVTLLTGSVTIANPACGLSNGSVTGLSETGGNSPYYESWTNTSGDTISNANNLTGIPAGTYTFTVIDQSGCTTDTTFNINSGGGLVLNTSGLVVTPASCGLANGSITGLSVNDGGVPYTAVWDTGGILFANTISITDLGANTYVLTVTDSNHCTVDTTITITGGISTVPPAITATPDTICADDSSLICLSPATYASYIWNTGQTTACIYATEAGNYYATVTDEHDCQATSGHVEVNVYPAPSVSLSIAGDTFTVYENRVLQWYLNGTPIAGATGQTYIAKETGNYSVEIISADGCVANSNVFYYSAGIAGVGPDEVNIYPNPLSAGSWQMDVSENYLGHTFVISDDNGREVYRSQIRSLHSEIPSNFASGVYFLQISSIDNIIVRKIVKL
jgi:hypothetical protein